ncbi:hypothetical protein [Gordonia insulae]|uniref:Diacylglycerol O-acyltransferase n=1 Tax=Gordonia insulae TaxID=2420509 RepID=A0A3G8JKU8_9ACTN|nr:hypothetical protein [Gordonia insulae]AZG45704.1 hypothetical protein D7316_02304 [Gordonia insulae]
MLTNSAGQRPGQVRVAALDLQHSRRRSALVVGPAEFPSRDVAAARLRALAAVGSETRIGLEPSSETTRWRFCAGDIGDAVVEVPMPADPINLFDVVRSMPDRQLRVVLAGDHLAIDFSHGLGDVSLLQTIVDVIVGGIDPADDELWRRYRGRRSPLGIAALRTFGSDPRRLATLLRFHRHRPEWTSDRPATGAFTPQRPARVRATKIPGTVAGSLRAARDRTAPGVGMFAVYTCALRRSLVTAGIPVNPMVTLPVDVRTYLPDDVATLASFSAGLAFDVGDDVSPAELQRSLTESIRMGRPVANLLVGTAKLRMATKKRRATVDHDARLPDHPVRANLLHSSVGRTPRTDHLRWLSPDHRLVLGLADPVGHTGITVTSAMVDTSIWMTATFDDSVFDADRVACALEGVAAAARQLLGGP